MSGEKGTTVESSFRIAKQKSAESGEKSNSARRYTLQTEGEASSSYDKDSELNAIRDKNWYVGVTYPGALVGYKSGSYSVGIRGFQQNDVTIYGPRFTHHVFPFRGGNIYWGLDGFYIENFEGDLTEGDGYMSGGFVGIQKYIGEWISFNVDSGPYYVNITDDLSGESVDGGEFVVNTNINVHF